MPPQARRRSRYDLPEPDPVEAATTPPSHLHTPSGSPFPNPTNAPSAPARMGDPGTFEAQQALRGAFETAGRALNDDLMGVHAEMSRRLETLSGRLRDTQTEIDRLNREMETMRGDRVHELLAKARERLGAM